MPELPEVEVVRAGLEPFVVGARIAGVEVLDARSLRRHRGDDFAAGLQGETVLAAVRRGKYLWFPLSSGRALVAHLGMSGQLLVHRGDPAERAPERSLRVRLRLDTVEHGAVAVHFVDQRVFGSLALDELVATADGHPGGHVGATVPGPWAARIPRSVAHIARDPLDAALDDEALVRRVRSSGSGVKRILLDQTRLSGVGNIYADEALWRARVHYDRAGRRLHAATVRRVLAAVREVLSRALAAGGTSFDSLYVDVNGRSGYFERSLAVYGRAGRPCHRCGAAIVREPFMNRSSYRCPRCQRPPRP